MARVLDLTTDDDDDVLHRTEASGLFRAGSLVDEPLATHLAAGETARYLLGNRKAGVEVSADGEHEHLEPGDDYRAFLLLTDRRLVFVVGAASGDRTRSVPFADVLDVGTESSGLLSTALVVVTADERRFAFPCRGDLAPVVETVRDDAAAWSHAERLLERADDAIERTRSRLSANDHEAADEAMAAATAAWEEALQTLAPVHESAVAGLRERVAVRREMATGLPREIAATAGADAHAEAQAAWRERDYERAAEAYASAARAYESSLTRSGTTPTDDQLQRRLGGVAHERALLGVGPVVDAEAVANRAARTDDPAQAADRWERALARYRRALELEWGEDGRAFRVDREAVRSAAADVVAAAIDARLDASREWTVAGDDLAVDADEETAARAYRRARTHVERARELAVEARPDREATIEEWHTAIDDRLAGELEPAAADLDASLPAASLDAVIEELDDLEPLSPQPSGTETATNAAGDDGVPDQTPVPVGGPAEAGQQGRAAGTDDEGDEQEPGVIDTGEGDTAERDRGEGGAADDTPGASQEAVADAVNTTAGREEDGDGRWRGAEGERGGADYGRESTTAEAETVAGGPPAGESDPPVAVADAAGATRESEAIDGDELQAALEEAPPAARTDLVADVYRARGWASAVFEAGGSAVYDVLCVSPETETRLCLWVTDQSDRPVAPTSVERLTTVRSRLAEDTRVALVTTGSLSTAVRDRAAQDDVALVDGAGLCDMLVATGYADALLDGTA